MDVIQLWHFQGTGSRQTGMEKKDSTTSRFHVDRTKARKGRLELVRSNIASDFHCVCIIIEVMEHLVIGRACSRYDILEELPLECNKCFYQVAT